MAEIDLHIVGGLPLPQTNPTWRVAAILKNRYDVITWPQMFRFRWNLLLRCRMTCW